MKIGRNDKCWCGSGKKFKQCHLPIEEKIAKHYHQGDEVPTRELLKTKEQIRWYSIKLQKLLKKV